MGVWGPRKTREVEEERLPLGSEVKICEKKSLEWGRAGMVKVTEI